MVSNVDPFVHGVVAAVSVPNAATSQVPIRDDLFENRGGHRSLKDIFRAHYNYVAKFATFLAVS